MEECYRLQPATLLKVTLLLRCFSRFFNCAHGIKSRNAPHILPLLDVLSRFHWLVPLQSKHSRKVKSELKKIFDQHGNPRTLQSDRGKDGEVKMFCEKRKIEMKKSRPLLSSVTRKSRMIS